MRPSKEHPERALLSGLLWGLLLCSPVRAVQFAGGTGEPNDPYQIATAQQLLAIGSDRDLIRKHYVLTASIDLSGTTLSDPAISSFYGTFDGQGYVIRNFRAQSAGPLGLFGFLLQDAKVRNLGLVDARVTSPSSCGALASQNYGGSVLNCYSTGVVSSTRTSAGGLVGRNDGTLANCYCTVQVSGGNGVGGLVGENMGTISSCHSTSEVVGSGSVGGLVGWNMGGQITSSYCTATVTGSSREVGGLVGNNSGTIALCYCDATVTGESYFVGGLVGINRNSISSCHSTGRVTGQESVGGLVGSNDGLIASSCADAIVVSYGRAAGGLAGDSNGGISNCYSTGSVEGGNGAGGLVGYDSGKISTSYSVASVVGYGWDTGGLVGQLATAPTAVKDCYFLDPMNGGGPDNWIGTPLTSAQMKLRASFSGWDFWGTTADGIDDPWFMPTKAYPVLAWQREITGLRVVPNVAGLSLDKARAALTAAGFVVGAVTYDFARATPAGQVICVNPYPLATAGATIDLIVSSGGTYNWVENPGIGSIDRPYQIQTAGQLESLTDHPEMWNSYFVLAADLDMAGRTYTVALIAPDVDNSNSGFQGMAFSGSFDGQGHAIRNLTIHGDSHHDYFGLFGMIAPGGRIDNLRLLDVDISGGTGSKTYLGALAGYNAGTVTNCSATGILHGGRGDGLVGFNSGTLTDCQADTMRR